MNSISGGRHLARVSKTPGRTRRIHFFADRRAGLALVDLPGYGFARVAKSDRERFAAAVERYLCERPHLRGLVLLLDVRRAPGVEERMLVDFARSRAIGVTPVATKVDKLGRAERMRRLRELDRAGIGTWIPFSAATGEGRDAVIEAVLGCVRALA